MFWSIAGQNNAVFAARVTDRNGVRAKPAMRESPHNGTVSIRRQPPSTTEHGSVKWQVSNLIESSAVMPILPPEPDIYPDDLFEAHDTWAADDCAAENSWWALYTLPRREKNLMRRLRAMKIPFYGPVVEHRGQSPNGRRRVSHIPLFAGYVFLRGTDEQRRRSLTTGCVSRCLAVPDPESLTNDLRRLRQLIESGEALTPESRLEPGRRVVVRCGSLAGIEGVVIKRHGRSRLVVSVEFLQQGASVLLDDMLVEPTD